ncbi:site-specific DNA-methyltransferase [Helicobacter pylori]|uniref:site-specific DNA-methyltransferase n=1 Tax=Helicobacter pylori TaxID=210 RepID=UPI00165C243D|nr:site-specific DNA-methyltransferase [Helicobacter pylori]MBH0235787.1 site-specific DNA-methyltransferase [Helicobacter pylori]MBH0251923.1 site-specific DNA-methyltransferase [Helicobacter pylori]MBH0271106.1 site-specific DNA-methyltransferase [Helicobacter pylori]
MTDKNQAKKMGINIIQSQQENNPLFDMLLKNFPQTIKDGQVSLSAIKTLLGFNEGMNDISGYELTWTGKGLANALYSEPCQKQLKLQEIFTPQNLASKHPNNAIIIGDNLDALKLLKSAYSEKIKMIYIDPPYNTTNENFIYPDNFRQDYQKILREVGLMEIDENGKEIESESLKFFKNIQGSRTHSGWLSFMLPRLKLARDLLKEDGVIFISIDDNEAAQLKLLCDEIFGEDNFVATIIWEKKYSPQNHTKWFSDNHDFILLYAKDKEIWRPNLLPRTSEMNARYKNLDNDERGVWKSSDLSVGSAVERNIYPIFNPHTKQEIYPPHGRSWVYSQEKLQELIADNRIFFPTSGSGVPCYKRFLNEVKQGATPLTIWKYTEVGHTQDAKREIKELFDGQALFDTPKPEALLQRILEISTQENDTILDFFAGSGTTAHAVMELNAEDKGNREFILVQIDEEIKEDKSAYDFCKNVLKSAKPIISDITIERVKRAAQKIIQSSKDSGLDLGFKVYTLQDKAQIANDKEEITLFNRSDLTPFDKALNLALQCGKTLNCALETTIKDKLYKCQDAYFCIVCDKEVQEYLAKSKNEMIFLDGYEEIDLEAFLNINASFKERLSVVY